eukprot:scaffold54679_cov29-Phaeocystis_antarctica.AAC.2
MARASTLEKNESAVRGGGNDELTALGGVQGTERVECPACPALTNRLSAPYDPNRALSSRVCLMCFPCTAAARGRSRSDFLSPRAALPPPCPTSLPNPVPQPCTPLALLVMHLVSTCGDTPTISSPPETDGTAATLRQGGNQPP